MVLFTTFDFRHTHLVLVAVRPVYGARELHGPAPVIADDPPDIDKGDAAFIDNEYIHKMYNADLFLNTINWLAEEEELISIRPKTTRGSRVLMTPKETRDIFYMSVLILPEALLLFGLAIWWRRR